MPQPTAEVKFRWMRQTDGVTHVEMNRNVLAGGNLQEKIILET
jgi:hypothetical protein